ncbi:MAG: aldolase/citrate lyase family protein [Desulfurococcaceae archaeon]
MSQYGYWRKRVSEKLGSGKPLLGTWVTMPHPEVVEILSNMAFDWVLIDMEHAPIDIEKAELLLMAIRNPELIPLIRPPWNDPVVIKRALDLGVAGVIVPWVNTKEEAEKAVEAAKYPPTGIRGVGPRRCVMYGFWDSVKYFNEWNQNAIVIAQLETKKGLENLEEIISVEGLSGIFVGPSDLSASLGMYGMQNTEEFKEILFEIVKRAKPYGKIIGIMANSPETAREFAEMGYNFISLSHDIRYLVKGAELFLSQFMKST